MRFMSTWSVHPVLPLELVRLELEAQLVPFRRELFFQNLLHPQHHVTLWIYQSLFNLLDVQFCQTHLIGKLLLRNLFFQTGKADLFAEW